MALSKQFTQSVRMSEGANQSQFPDSITIVFKPFKIKFYLVIL